MTSAAQPHNAAQGGQERPAHVERDPMMALETKPAAVLTQTARCGLARRSERLPFTGAIDGRAELPAITAPVCGYAVSTRLHLT